LTKRVGPERNGGEKGGGNLYAFSAPRDRGGELLGGGGKGGSGRALANEPHSDPKGRKKNKDLLEKTTTIGARGQGKVERGKPGGSL